MKRGPRRGCSSPTPTARRVVSRLQSGGERCHLRSRFEPSEMQPSWRSDNTQKPEIATLCWPSVNVASKRILEMNVKEMLCCRISHIHVKHWFCRGSSFNTRVLIRSAAGNLRDIRNELGLKPWEHTSTVAWTTPRNPYVMHGGYSVIQVELLHE